MNTKTSKLRAFGGKATLRLLEIINAGPITVVRVGSRDRDQYGRQLLVIRRDGWPITEALIAEGFGPSLGWASA
jgi:endonuclease YncB( thermonuclease family)